jgi:hypothetical protein
MKGNSRALQSPPPTQGHDDRLAAYARRLGLRCWSPSEGAGTEGRESERTRTQDNIERRAPESTERRSRGIA